MKANISDVKLVKPVKNSATHVDKWAASLAQILNWFWYDKPAFRLNYKKSGKTQNYARRQMGG